jgi:hypothetical protein
MNMWHCKKQGPSRTGIFSESGPPSQAYGAAGRWQVTGDETLVKIDNVKVAAPATLRVHCLTTRFL